MIALRDLWCVWSRAVLDRFGVEHKIMLVPWLQGRWSLEEPTLRLTAGYRNRKVSCGFYPKGAWDQCRTMFLVQNFVSLIPVAEGGA